MYRDPAPKKARCDSKNEPVNEMNYLAELDQFEYELRLNCKRAQAALLNWRRLFVTFNLRKGLEKKKDLLE